MHAVVHLDREKIVQIGRNAVTADDWSGKLKEVKVWHKVCKELINLSITGSV